MTASSKDKTKFLRQGMFFLAAIFLIIGIALAVGWSIRGTRQADFCGIGQAQVLDVTSEQRIDWKNRTTRTRYSFSLHVTAGSSEFDCVEKRESRNGWKKGDILPIVYNVKNPKEFVLNISPEELMQWDHTMGIIAVIVLLVGFVCLFVGTGAKRIAARKEKDDPYLTKSGE